MGLFSTKHYAQLMQSPAIQPNARVFLARRTNPKVSHTAHSLSAQETTKLSQW